MSSKLVFKMVCTNKACQEKCYFEISQVTGLYKIVDQTNTRVMQGVNANQINCQCCNTTLALFKEQEE